MTDSGTKEQNQDLRDYHQSQFQKILEHVQPSLDVQENVQHPLLYPLLAMANELGEVSDVVKKAIRDQNGMISPAAKYKILDELGDIHWYLTLTAAVLGYTLDDVIAFNVSKLVDRYGRDGSGQMINETYANLLPDDVAENLSKT